MTTTQLPFSIAVDDMDTPRDLIDAMVLSAFMTGEQPYAQTKRLSKVLRAARLLPAEGTLQRAVTDEGARSHLACGDGWTLRAVRWRGGSAEVTVTATSDELASRIMREATENAKDTRPRWPSFTRSSAASPAWSPWRRRRRSATTSDGWRAPS